MTTIRPARADELTDVGALIALSFDDLAANAFLVPVPARRQRVMAGYFTLYVEHAYTYGRVDVLEVGGRMTATAVWFDRSAPLADPADYEPRLIALAGPHFRNFAALDALLDKHHPRDPHWHLAFVAVDPASQGQGLGGALIDRTHAELDRSGLPAYLEGTNPNNVRLYRRHGYREMDPHEILLPDGTPFYRMWRPTP